MDDVDGRAILIPLRGAERPVRRQGAYPLGESANARKRCDVPVRVVHERIDDYRNVL
jgi:hypothetical protein